MSAIMQKTWADEEHVGKLTVSIMNTLSKKFHTEAKKPEEEVNDDKLIKFSQAIGYQAQIFSGLQKNHEFAKRLQSVEKILSRANTGDPMTNNPVINAEKELNTDSKLV